MGWRGLVAVVTLLAAGIVGGFALADQMRSMPIGTGSPRPVAAASPQFPLTPTSGLKQDPPQAPMGLNLPLRRASVGTSTYAFKFPAPRGWSRSETSSNEVKYKKAGNPTNTYLLRVEQVTSQNETVPDILAARIDELKRDEEQVRITFRRYDTIEFNYVHDGYRRFGIITWMSLTDAAQATAQAEAEIAISGRAVDLPGMRNLLDAIYFGRGDMLGIRMP